MPLRPFLEKMKSDDDFRRLVYKEVLPGLVAAAKNEGYDVSEEEYQNLLEKYKHQLTDEQLEAVSGGCNCRWIEQCANGGDYTVGN
jgi:predicted ribosomally synthesized peptide with nif11-like leader